jgi:hypothetical protein
MGGKKMKILLKASMVMVIAFLLMGSASVTSFGQCPCVVNCPAGDNSSTPALTGGYKTPDLNGDGAVNLIDFALFAACYPSPPNAYCFCADYDCNFLINLVDFAIFATHWGHIGPLLGFNQPGVDHYKTYEVLDPLFIVEPIILRDQFGEEFVDTMQLEKFATPVSKNRQPFCDSLAHLSWWRFDRPEPQRLVKVQHQFGFHEFIVKDARYLLTPALKNDVTPELPELNHYKCYEAFGDTVLDIQVQLVDQFDSTHVLILEPQYFCNPCEKETMDGTVYPIVDTLAHMTVYRVLNPEPYNIQALMRDQFVEEFLTLGENHYLCLPSLKEEFTELTATIGDWVWDDLNQDGIQNAVELGIGGVTVELWDCSGAPFLVANTTTDANGFYSFTVNPGNYYVKFILPAGYVFSPQDVGADDTIDSDPNPANGQTVCTNLVAGEVDMTWDAGMYIPTQVETDHYKTYEVPGGPYIEMPLILRDQFGEEYADTMQLAKLATPVSKNGEPIHDPLAHLSWWEFFQTHPHPTRIVTVENQFGLYDWTVKDPRYLLLPALKNSSPDDVIPDKNHYLCYKAFGDTMSINVTLVDQFDSSTVFVVEPAYFCNPVEKEIPGGIVYPIVDSLAHFTIYRVLNPNAYDIPVTVLDQFGFWTDIRLEENRYLCVPADKKQVIVPATIGNHVWDDLNQDGIQNDGAAGMGGVTVELWDCSGPRFLVATTATNATGFYSFTVNPGNYYVKFFLPPGYVFSPQDVGLDDTIDSDPDPTNGETACTTLTPGEVDMTWDAGMYMPTVMEIDHYKTYETLGPTFNGQVFMRDQFGEEQTTFMQMSKFATPVSKNDEPIYDPEAHLSWWEFDPSQPHPIRIVDVENQFGTFDWTVRDPRYLLLPALKYAASGDPIPVKNHYLCYEAQGDTMNITVMLTDQFDSSLVFVLEPAYFCNPCEKEVDGVIYPVVDDMAHLTVYLIQNPNNYHIPVTVLDQFGFWMDVFIEENRYLCVPAQKHGWYIEPGR